MLEWRHKVFPFFFICISAMEICSKNKVFFFNKKWKAQTIQRVAKYWGFFKVQISQWYSCGTSCQNIYIYIWHLCSVHFEKFLKQKIIFYYNNRCGKCPPLEGISSTPTKYFELQTNFYILICWMNIEPSLFLHYQHII